MHPDGLRHDVEVSAIDACRAARWAIAVNGNNQVGIGLDKDRLGKQATRRVGTIVIQPPLITIAIVGG